MTLYLPRAQTVAATEPSAAAERPARSGTVLLVEDNPDVASASAGLLEQLGYSRALGAERRGRAATRSSADGIDLVFSDIVMPGRWTGWALRARSAQSGRTCRSCSPPATATAAHDVARRIPDPAQALPDARAQPRARGDPAGRSLKRDAAASKKARRNRRAFIVSN